MTGFGRMMTVWSHDYDLYIIIYIFHLHSFLSKFNFQLLHNRFENSKDVNILHFNGEQGKKIYLKNYAISQH